MVGECGDHVLVRISVDFEPWMRRSPHLGMTVRWGASLMAASTSEGEASAMCMVVQVGE